VARLKVLIVEDVENDAKLAERALRAGGVEFVSQRVETREDFLGALERQRPDVILADCRLPHFDGREALRLAREQLPDTPVIMVTGTLIDEIAVELLREGAADYILKDRLSRLVPAVRRALDDAKMKAARREVEERYRALFERAREGIVLVDCDTGRIIDCNPEFAAQAGRPVEQLRQLALWDLRPPEDVAAARKLFERVMREGTGGSVLPLRRPDGSDLPIEFRSSVIGLDGKRFMQSWAHDISEQLRTEAQLRTQIDELQRFQRVTVDRELRMQELEAQLARLGATAPKAA